MRTARAQDQHVVQTERFSQNMGRTSSNQSLAVARLDCCLLAPAPFRQLLTKCGATCDHFLRGSLYPAGIARQHHWPIVLPFVFRIKVQSRPEPGRQKPARPNACVASPVVSSNRNHQSHAAIRAKLSWIYLTFPPSPSQAHAKPHQLAPRATCTRNRAMCSTCSAARPWFRKALTALTMRAIAERLGSSSFDVVGERLFVQNCQCGRFVRHSGLGHQALGNPARSSPCSLKFRQRRSKVPAGESGYAEVNADFVQNNASHVAVDIARDDVNVTVRSARSLPRSASVRLLRTFPGICRAESTRWNYCCDSRRRVNFSPRSVASSQRASGQLVQLPAKIVDQLLRTPICAGISRPSTRSVLNLHLRPPGTDASSLPELSLRAGESHRS